MQLELTHFRLERWLVLKANGKTQIQEKKQMDTLLIEMIATVNQLFHKLLAVAELSDSHV